MVCVADYMDDKELHIAPSWGMEMWLYLLRNLGYFVAFLGFAGAFASPRSFAEPEVLPMIIGGGGIGIILHVASYLIPKRQAVFDRTAGTVRTPAHPLIRKKPTETPFEEWEAITRFYYTQIGSPTYEIFVRNTHIPYIVLIGVAGTFDQVLAMWSFLLQYMKKDAPLPDVPDLEQYPNRTKGLGTWEEWKWKSRLPDFVDPYEVAKAKMDHEQDGKETDRNAGMEKPDAPTA